MTTTRKHITPNQREIQMNDAKSDWEKLQQARQLHAAAEEQRQARRSAEAWDARQREHRRVQDMIDAMGSALAEDGRRRAEERGREAPEFFVSNKEADEIKAAIKSVQENHRQIAERLDKRPKRIRAPSGKVYEILEGEDGTPTVKKT